MIFHAASTASSQPMHDETLLRALTLVSSRRDSSHGGAEAYPARGVAGRRGVSTSSSSSSRTTSRMVSSVTRADWRRMVVVTSWFPSLDGRLFRANLGREALSVCCHRTRTTDGAA